MNKIKVVIKRPNEKLQIIEVKDLKEINELLGNFNEKGEADSFTGSDYRQGIFKGIDMHVNGNSLFNANLSKNFWDVNGNRLYCGNVIFTGYDSNERKEYGVCSLTDEQIDYLTKNIRTLFEI